MGERLRSGRRAIPAAGARHAGGDRGAERARSLLKAIVWHGGEAQRSRDAVLQSSREERDALLAFLDSL